MPQKPLPLIRINEEPPGLYDEWNAPFLWTLGTNSKWKVKAGFDLKARSISFSFFSLYSILHSLFFNTISLDVLTYCSQREARRPTAWRLQSASILAKPLAMPFWKLFKIWITDALFPSGNKDGGGGTSCGRKMCFDQHILQPASPCVSGSWARDQYLPPLDHPCVLYQSPKITQTRSWIFCLEKDSKYKEGGIRCEKRRVG